MSTGVSPRQRQGPIGSDGDRAKPWVSDFGRGGSAKHLIDGGVLPRLPEGWEVGFSSGSE